LELSEGDVDPGTGYKIAFLVGAYATCIVYLDEKDNIHYRCTERHEWPDERDFARFEVQVDVFKAAAKAQLPNAEAHGAVYILAEGIAFALESHDFDAAKAAINRVKEILGQAQRLCIVGTSLLLVALAIAGGIAIEQWHTALANQFGPEVTTALLCSAAAAAGAALSLMQRIGQFPLPVTAGRSADIIECIARFTIGAFAGAALFVAITADLLLGLINKMALEPASSRTALLLGLSLAIGASERAFPTLVRSMERHIH
jgi:hypothetical protein